jgi:hypothetical protein
MPDKGAGTDGSAHSGNNLEGVRPRGGRRYSAGVGND